MRAMVVGLDAGVRLAIEEVLLLRGHQISAYDRAEVALEAFQREAFPLVILDQSLPSMSGPDLCRQIRAAPGGLSAVILIVAERNLHTLEAVIDAGADDYIANPADLRLLDVRLAIAERRVREIAERQRIEGSLQLLAKASRLLATFFDYEAAIASVARLCVPSLADLCTVSLTQADGSFRPVAIIHVTPAKAEVLAELHRRYPGEAGPGLGGQRAIERGQPLVWSEISDSLLTMIARDAEHLALLRALDLRSLLCAPIATQGQTLGVLAVGQAESGRQFGDADLALVEDLADRMAQAIHNALLYGKAREADAQFRLQLAECERAKAALRASEERFRRLAENAPDIIYRYEFKPSERFSYVSPAVMAILGYRPEDFYADARLVCRVVHGDDHALLTAIRSGHTVPRPLILQLHHRDGHIVWAEVGVTPVYDEMGDLVAVEGIVHDITERRQLEEQLLRAQRLEAAGRIAGQVAHDFNNLLGPLMGYPDLIKAQLPPGHPAIAFCDAILEAAQRMTAISDDLLVLGRRGLLEREIVNMNQLVELAIAEIVDRPDSLVIEARLAPDLLPVSGSESQLLRMLANLIRNAREAMNDVGTMTITTANVYVDAPFGRYSRVAIGEYVRLDVSDTGRGIPPEIRDQIFEAFFTTKRTDRRRGAGMGLTIVQAIVEDHRGYIDFESEVNKGTTFSVYLPVHRGDQQPEKPADSPTTAATILVVDDDAAQRALSRQLLEALGYRVYVAASGEDAIAFLRRQPVDLLILDMVMPFGMDGVETYRQALAIQPGVRAIVVSGFAETERVRQAQALGAGAHIRKPVTLERLAQAVRAELARGR